MDDIESLKSDMEKSKAVVAELQQALKSSLDEDKENIKKFFRSDESKIYFSKADTMASEFELNQEYKKKYEPLRENKPIIPVKEDKQSWWKRFKTKLLKVI